MVCRSHFAGVYLYFIALLGVGCRTTTPDSGEKVAQGEPDSGRLSLAQEVVWRSLESGYATGGDFGDIDGDGLLDLVVSEGNDMEQGLIRVYFNQGGSLEEEASFWTEIPQFYGHLALGDLNGDGWTDMAISKFLGTERFDEPGGVEVFLSEEGELPRVPSWEWNGAYTFSLALGDVDSDGDVDIAVAVGEVYYNDPDVSFLLCNDGTGSFVICWEDAEPRYSFDVSLVDLNRDGWQDLVFAHQGEGHSIRWGSDNLFSNLPDWQAQEGGFEGNTLDWGDINGDGVLDLIVSDNNQLGGLGVIRGWCGSNFVLCWESEDEPLMQSALALRDFDGDGDVDLAASSWWGALRMYEQTEAGLSRRPIFVGEDFDIVAEAFAWAPISAVDKEWIVGSGVLEVPVRRSIAYVDSGVFGGGYLFGNEIRAQIFVNKDMRLVLTDWEKNQGNWMFAPVPMEE